jgi:hypothetical protein
LWEVAVSCFFFGGFFGFALCAACVLAGKSDESKPRVISRDEFNKRYSRVV